MSMDLPLLWHIPLSHFNEKVRWALDFKNIPHRRERVGGDYLFKAWRATGYGTLPILFLDGQPIRDSTAIIAELEGDRAVVMQTFARIYKDRRRKDIVVLSEKQVSERLFDEWSMGYAGNVIQIALRGVWLCRSI